MSWLRRLLARFRKPKPRRPHWSRLERVPERPEIYTLPLSDQELERWAAELRQKREARRWGRASDVGIPVDWLESPRSKHF